MTTDNKIAGFVALLDRAKSIAQERIKLRAEGHPDMAPPGSLERIVQKLSDDREEALSGKLPPSRGVVTIGVLRAVADWGELTDSALLDAARDIESYYLEKLK